MGSTASNVSQDSIRSSAATLRVSRPTPALLHDYDVDFEHSQFLRTVDNARPLEGHRAADVHR